MTSSQPAPRNLLENLDQVFDLDTVRDDCLRLISDPESDLSTQTPAVKALVAAYREMPILADILAAGINQRYAEYYKTNVVRGRADFDLLKAIHGCEEAAGLYLTFERKAESLALFEHPDFHDVINEFEPELRDEIRSHQQRWRDERKKRRAALKDVPPTI